MKKYLCLIIVCAISFMLIGCGNNADVNETTTSDENSTEVELTNPGEYLADLCSNVKIYDAELSLPCSFETADNFFELTYLSELESLEGYPIKSYMALTPEDKYFGVMTFIEYGEENIESWIMFNDYRKGNISNFSEDMQKKYADDETTFTVDDFISGKTKRSEIVEKLGEGFVSKPLINEGQMYDFEDGRLVILYDDNDTAIEFHICFNIKTEI